MPSKKTEKRYTRANGLISKQVTIEGKRKVFYGHTEQEIMQKVLAYRGDVAAGPMFSEVAESWWNEKQPTIRHGTVVCYRPALKRAIAHFQGQRIKEISATDISRLLANMKADGLAQKTIANTHSVLNMIFEHWCARYGGTANPSALISTPSAKKDTRKPPTEEQFQAVYRQLAQYSVDDPDQGAIIAAVFLYTGVRRGEGLALRLSDITQQEIHITKSIEHQGNNPVEGETKTYAGVRTIPLLPQLQAIIAPLKEAHPPSTYLFGLEQTPMSQRQYRNRWLDFCKRCNLAHSSAKPDQMKKGGKTYHITRTVWKPDVTAHQFRHGFATALFCAGVPMEVAVRMMGHADSEMIRRVYLDINHSMMQNAATMLSTYMSAQSTHNSN